jgi:hypothetical protein
MKNYTDEQYIVVAKWVGAIFKESNQFGQWYYDDKRITCWDVSWRTNLELRGWFLKDGRFAIEDKFANEKPIYACWNAPDEGTDEYVICVGDIEKGWSVIGHGPTPAEAWLDAAIEITEEMK